MKLISYCLFNHPSKRPFEKFAYVRGFYFNARMNNLIYADWRTHLEIEEDLYSEFKNFFDWLVENNYLSLSVNHYRPALCEGMLWRLKALFMVDVDHILVRDADAITTYREAQCVQQWLESDMPFHAINDNPAHGGIMGGMVGFDNAQLKAIMGWDSFQNIIAGLDLNQHGSDQQTVMRQIGQLGHLRFFLHQLSGSGFAAGRIEREVPKISLPRVSPNLWESDLTCRHIGSAGVVEMELLRFLSRWDEYNWKFQVAEQMVPQVCYWQKF